MNEATARLGVSLRQTEDQLTRDMLASTASQVDCVGGINGDSPTNITRQDISTVVATLLGNNAYTISDMIDGEDKFGTAPVRNCYFVLSNTQLTTNLEGVEGFTHVSQYPRSNGVLPVNFAGIKFSLIDLEPVA